jgi:hypothetical protein
MNSSDESLFMVTQVHEEFHVRQKNEPRVQQPKLLCSTHSGVTCHPHPAQQRPIQGSTVAAATGQ